MGNAVSEIDPTAIDAHVHLWSLARGDYGWMTDGMGPILHDFGPADLRARLDAGGIARCILVQAAPTVAEPAYMLGLAEANDWIAGVVGWVDFEAATALADLERLARHPRLRGVRPMIQDIPDVDWMLRPQFAPIFDAIPDLGLTFDALPLPRHLPNLLTLLKRHPALPCVVDHGAKPRIREGLAAMEGWADDMRRLAGDTGALCKLSGLVTEAGADWTPGDVRPFAEHILAVFGPDRVMWGSDWPVVRLAGSHADWLAQARAITRGLAPGEREAVFGKNAARFYGV